MAVKNIFQHYLFDSASDISGVTAVHITQNAVLSDQAVRLEQLTSGLALKNDVLSAGAAIGSLAGDTINVQYDDVTIGLDTNTLEVKDNGINEAQLHSDVDAETFLTTAHSWLNITGGSIQVALEDLDASISDSVLTVAAGSVNLLDITAGEISVTNLLITDVTVDAVSTGITEFVAANYTVGNELQEGDLAVMPAAPAPDRTWVHNGGVAGTIADFTVITDALSAAQVRGYLSGGAALDYNATTGVFDVKYDDDVVGVNGSDELTIKINGIDDTHIDFGTGANQVSAVDLPIADSGANFTSTEVEGALSELADSINAISDTDDQNLEEVLIEGSAASISTGLNITVSISGETSTFSLEENEGVFRYETTGSTVSQFLIDASGVRMEYQDGSSDQMLITFDDSAAVMTDAINSKGLEYADDYSANYTNRSLVDKEYVDSLDTDDQTFNEVLTEGNTTGGLDIVVTSGDVIASAIGDNQIAMDVDGDILISSDGGLKAESWYLVNASELQLGFGDTGSINIDGSSARLRQQPSSGGQSEFSAFNDKAFMGYESTGATIISIELSEDAGTVTDDVNTKGLVYESDYKANFTDNSLITKLYADEVKTSKEYSATGLSLTANVALNINHALASTVIHVMLFDGNGDVPDLQITRIDLNNIELLSNTNLTDIECFVTAHG